MNWFKKEEWSWWQAGLLLGLLNIAVFYTANYYLSVSTTFSRRGHAGWAGRAGTCSGERLLAKRKADCGLAIHARVRHPHRRILGGTVKSKSRCV